MDKIDHLVNEIANLDGGNGLLHFMGDYYNFGPFFFTPDEKQEFVRRWLKAFKRHDHAPPVRSLVRITYNVVGKQRYDDCRAGKYGKLV